jgi:N-carbamoyl-L-amino-acid hydrolase
MSQTHPTLPNSNTPAANAVDAARLWRRLQTMAGFGARSDGGVNRQALSVEDIASKQTLIDWALARGFTIHTDPIGNLFVRRAGSDPDAAPVMTGSHLDSQPTGGKFDGAYGVLAGFEALEALEDAGIVTRRPIEAVAWTNEEGSRFQPGAMGSACFVGRMDLAALRKSTGRDGVNLGEALDATLVATAKIAQPRPFGVAVAAYVEAHIEQGPRLEAEGKVIGAVSGIQGSRWFAVEISGAEAHAGTTPMALRKDALKAAVAMVTALEQLLADPTDTIRFTVGRFEVSPGSPNTVPGKVFFTIDFRHPDAALLDRLCIEIPKVCAANARGCAVTVTPTFATQPVAFPKEMTARIEQAAEALGLSNMSLLSGAFHDAKFLAEVTPSAMIFIPCAGGVSHNPIEDAKPEDCAAGARVLAEVLVGLANS